jgi:hypothetical protein
MITRSKKRLLEVENEIDIINKKTKIEEEKEKIIDDNDKSSEEEEDEEIDDDDDDDYEDLQEYIEKLKNKDKKAYENFVETSFYISNLEPNIVEILKTPMKLKDKAKLVELYEIYKCFDLPT